MNLRGVIKPRSNLVKVQNGDMLADSHNILEGGRTTIFSYV
jgi:hypothetical protein